MGQPLPEFIRRNQLRVSCCLVLLNRAHDETIGVLLGSFYEAKREPILVRFSFGLTPSYIRNSFDEKPDNERILALDFIRINGEKLGNPVGHDLLELLTGHRLEAAEQLGAHEASCREISLFCRRGRVIGEINFTVQVFFG